MSKFSRLASCAREGCEVRVLEFDKRPTVAGGILLAEHEVGNELGSELYDSINGKIATAWKRDGQRLALGVVVPVNTTATVCVPARDVASVTEGGKPAASAEGVKFLRIKEDNAMFEVGSGTYKFASETKL